MKLTISLLCLLCLCGCRAYDVEVNAWTDGSNISSQPYCIVAAAADMVPSDLQFAQYAAWVKLGLAERGYTETSLEKAQTLIAMAYGMNGPYAASYVSAMGATPTVTGAAGYSSANAGGATSVSASVAGDADDPPAGGATSAGVSVAHVNRMHGEPVFVGGYYGSYYNGYTSSVFVRFLHLAAYDNVGGHRGAQRWRVDITSSGTENDLRSIMPFLVAAAYNYIGTDTEHQLDMTITAKDPRYLLISGKSR
jgi:hypothetical protein